ncbi:MAG: amidohydrolase family protein [Rhodospirillales bacterium]|jgi:aminocarboxymuconate-semialdehyde decarboxylase|nr:aminocarboxymuconate-semialdehyde decarboxylase [Rhodospirillaceae bacterium]MDP6427784.1 amidohydrolase family protein [Rhodospirillales bacterium]MDP6644582.1 amidohydrolase family protein [Rhodospirillales bacterium]
MFYRCAPHAPATDHGHGIQVGQGKKHFTVDIHCHVAVPAADAALEGAEPSQRQKANAERNPLTAEINARQAESIAANLTDPKVRLKDMDRDGIDVQAISPSPFHYNYGYPADATRESCRIINDRVAEIVAAHPDRFVGMGTVPLQDAGMAVAEMNRCIDDLGLKGIEISTNVDGKELTRAGLESFFARAEETGTLIFMHPIGTSFTERMDDHYFRNLIGHPLESALAVGHLVFDGYLDRYPGLKICIAHGGGYIPSYWGRFDHPWERRDDCRVNIGTTPMEHVKKLYFDTVVFNEPQLRHLIEVWGPDHIVMGTDYPFDMAQPDPVGHVDSVQGLSDADKARVMGGNAAKLLGIEVPAAA